MKREKSYDFFPFVTRRRRCGQNDHVYGHVDMNRKRAKAHFFQFSP
jgi:hypothetical protein